MNIDLKKLITILENKSNRAIDMLDEIKCTTPEFKTILDSVLNNLNAIKQVKQYDIDCPDCVKEKEIPALKEDIRPQGNNQQRPREENRPESPIGKKWVPFKGGK
jgi:hypothetical protein